MKKILSAIAMISILFLSGCTTKKSFTYDVETGDKIKVELDTTDGYDITSELPFEISKDGKVYSMGTFAYSDAYKLYSNVDSDENVVDFKKESKDNVEYIYYAYSSSDSKEYNYIIKIKNSSTVVILGNNVSEESAKEIFSKLSFEKES